MMLKNYTSRASSILGVRDLGARPQMLMPTESRIKAVMRHDVNMGQVKPDFYSSKTAVLAVSITGRPEEEEKVIASIELMGRTFHSCAIVLGDILARHTIAIDMDGKGDSAAMAYQIGLDWERKYRSVMDRQPIPMRLIHWDHWLEMKAFSDKRNLVLSLYHNDPVFHKSVNNFVQEYIARRKFSESENININNVCLEYAIEELTAMLFLAREKFDYILYPSELPEPLLMLIDRWIKPFYEHALQSRSFRYRSAGKRA